MPRVVPIHGVPRALSGVALLALGTSVVVLFIRPWYSLALFVLHLALMWSAHRLSKWRDNPGALLQYWDQHPKLAGNIRQSPPFTWRAGVHAQFTCFERSARGDYAIALMMIDNTGAPQPVRTAYEKAVASPTQATWLELRDAQVLHPPQWATERDRSWVL